MYHSKFVIAVLCALWFSGAPARAAEPAPADGPDEPAARPTGLEWLAFPTFKGNSDAGFVYGAQLEMIDYADGQEPFAWSLRLKLNHSTKNRHEHYLVFDTPHLLPYELRYFLQLELLHIKDANFFGVGNETVRDPNIAESFYQFQLTEPRVQTHVLRELYRPVFVVGGLTASFARVVADRGTLLRTEQPVGWQGGRSVAGFVGAGVDTRDHEIVTRRGVYAEIYSRFALTPLSQTSWFGGGFMESSYWAPVSWIVVAQRVMFEALGGTPPVTEMMRMGGTRNFRALGGVFSQRGFVENRFIGENKGLANLEIRGYFPPLFRHLVLGAGPFLDISRVFDGSGDVLRRWHIASGGEFTINWKESFLFRLDYAVSREGGEFYIEGRHLF